MSATTILAWIMSHKRVLRNVILWLSVILSLSYGIINHKRANRLSEELKIANNNIEAYLDAINGSLLASTVLLLDITKLKDQNDKLLQLIDSVRKINKIKSKEITAVATQKLYLDVNKSKGVGGNIITIIKDSTYKDSIQYNPLTKVYYTIGKDSVNIKLNVLNTLYLYVYKHKEYVNKKNFFLRLFTLDWKKKYVYKYKIHNTNDLIKEDSVRVIEQI